MGMFNRFSPNQAILVLFQSKCTTILCITVMTQWSVKIILVCNTDLFRKRSKIGLYLVCILRKSLYFRKCWKTIFLTPILKHTCNQRSNFKIIASAHGLCFLHSSISLLYQLFVNWMCGIILLDCSSVFVNQSQLRNALNEQE